MSDDLSSKEVSKILLQIKRRDDQTSLINVQPVQSRIPLGVQLRLSMEEKTRIKSAGYPDVTSEYTLPTAICEHVARGESGRNLEGDYHADLAGTQAQEPLGPVQVQRQQTEQQNEAQSGNIPYVVKWQKQENRRVVKVLRAIGERRLATQLAELNLGTELMLNFLPDVVKALKLRESQAIKLRLALSFVRSYAFKLPIFTKAKQTKTPFFPPNDTTPQSLKKYLDRNPDIKSTLYSAGLKNSKFLLNVGPEEFDLVKNMSNLKLGDAFRLKQVLEDAGNRRVRVEQPTEDILFNDTTPCSLGPDQECQAQQLHQSKQAWPEQQP